MLMAQNNNFPKVFGTKGMKKKEGVKLFPCD